MNIKHCIVKIGEGSGVLVQGKNDTLYILTCAHVLEGRRHNILTAFCDEEGDFSIELHTSIVADPVSEDAEDIALLHCPEGIPAHYQGVKMLSSQHGRDLPAYTYGFPTAFAKNGRDDRCRVDKLTVKSDQDIEWLKLSESTGMKGGFSGSPLLDARYQHCLGIVSDLEEPDEQHQGTLVYAVPAENISVLFADYLEVQNLSPYLARLRSMYQEVVLNDEKGMTLADVYVEPYYGVHKYCFKDSDKRVQYMDKPFHTINKSLHLDLAGFLKQEDILELEIQKPGLILLLGYPGQGKTSFCKRLIYDLTASTPLSFENIYHVRLRNVANPADLANNALKVIQTEIEEEFNAPTVNWHNALLVLDGLDELNIKEGFQSGKIDDICKSLEQATEKYAGLRIVLTSRYGYIDLDALKKRNIVILRLEELSFEQQITWLAKYRSERFHPESPLSPEKLEEYHKHVSIRELLGQPILLHMIASLEEDASEKPNRAAIYDSLFSQLIKRSWSSDKQISLLKDIGLDEKMLRYALQDIAHAIFMSGKGYLRRLDLENLPKVKTIQYKLRQQNRGVDLWRTVMIAAYLDEKKKHQQDQDERDQAIYGIEFLHKSLYEYLCAEKMWRDVRNAFLSTTPDGDWSIGEGKAALELANHLFSAQAMSQEVHDYLVEIITNYDNLADKENLSERMGLFLPYCLERHFLFSFDSNQEKGPILKAIANFRGYWIILSNLNQRKSYLYDRHHINSFAELYANRFFDKTIITRFNLRFQNLNGAKLIGADLSEVDLIGADLSGADLSGANLSRAGLIGANLTGTNLSKADLSEANLSQADLSGAILNGAILIEAKLIETKLVEAKLREAKLNYADLSWAKLNYADLSKADLMRADLSRADLSRANIDFQILEKSRNLYLTKGIPEYILKLLKAIKPFLLEEPKYHP